MEWGKVVEHRTLNIEVIECVLSCSSWAKIYPCVSVWIRGYFILYLLFVVGLDSAE